MAAHGYGGGHRVDQAGSDGVRRHQPQRAQASDQNATGHTSYRARQMIADADARGAGSRGVFEDVDRGAVYASEADRDQHVFRRHVEQLVRQVATRLIQQPRVAQQQA